MSILFQSTHPRRVWLLPVYEGSSSTVVSIHTPTQGVTQGALTEKQIQTVSIHTPTQGVTDQLGMQSVPALFQSTHPRRVWPLPTMLSVWLISFNPHTHAGCDMAKVNISRNAYSFNPHTHAGCDCVMLISRYMLFSFNPHTHAGCDSGVFQSLASLAVSIHTPTQGVTERQAVLQQLAGVSIHTPTQGVTTPVYIHLLIKRFNPHTHAGCDADNTDYPQPIRVSIHTPTQGVTWLSVLLVTGIRFQSTHPRRVWLCCRTIIEVLLTGFNPHTHAGCDTNYWKEL